MVPKWRMHSTGDETGFAGRVALDVPGARTHRLIDDGARHKYRRASRCPAAPRRLSFPSPLKPSLARSPMPSPSPTSSGAPAPWVGVIMGSRSDLRIMSHAVEILTELAIPHEVRVVSAHRTPDWMFEYADSAESRGLEVIIAAAGGAAHLPGMIAAKSMLPVLGVPIPATALNGVDALLAIVQMPRGVPVGTLAIGEPGAANAALLAAAIVGSRHPEVRERVRAWRAARTAEVMRDVDLDSGTR